MPDLNETNFFEEKDKKEIEEQFKKRWDTLNPKIKEFIKSAILKDLIKSLSEKYKLNITEKKEIEDAIVMICMCIVEIQDIYLLLEDLEKRNSLIQKAIADEIVTKIIPLEIQEIIKNNWEEDKETKEIIQDSVEFFETPLPPGFKNHEELLNNYLKQAEEYNLGYGIVDDKKIEPESIRPMVTKNEEIVSKMNQKPNENQVTWEDRIAMSNTSNPNITRRKNTDQTLPHISKLGGDVYREVIEE